VIANIFLPERYGSYFIISRRIAAVMITKHSIRIAVIRSARTQRFIEQLVEEPIDQDPAMPFAERVAFSLQKVLLQIPSSVRIMVVIPSSQVIFKMITVPRMSLEKIKLIVPFEVESMLPFAWSDAAIDCIVTHEDVHENKAHVLVVATTKTVLEEYRAYFNATGRTVEIITTSAVALCGLSQDIPQFFDPERPVITLCIDQYETIIMLANQGRILALRVISQGLYDVFVGEEFKRPALQDLIRNIASTAFNFLEQAGHTNIIPKLIICGIGSEHKEFCEAVSQEWNVACELLPISKILHTGTIISSQSMTNAFLLPIAAGLPHILTDDVNLDREREEKVIHQNILRQLGGTILVITGILAVFFVTRGIILNRMRVSFGRTNQEMISLIENNIEALKGKLRGKSLDSVMKLAEQEIAKNNIWFSLASSNRFAALRVLLELSKRLDRDKLGLDLRRLDFEYAPQEDREKLVLEGRVRDDKAVIDFEQSLRDSSMFSLPESLQKPEFTVHLKLNLKPEEF
jgi:Tfp pilus assembly PilM family ATPase